MGFRGWFLLSGACQVILVDVSLVGPSWCLPLWPRSRTGAVWGSHGGVGVTRAPPVLCRICVPFYFVSWRMRGCEPWGWLNPQAPSEEDQELLLVPLPLLGLFFSPGAAPKGSPAPRCPQIPLAPFPTPPSLHGLSRGGTGGGSGACPPLFVPYLSTGTAHKSLGYFRVVSLRFGVLDGESASRTRQCN